MGVPVLTTQKCLSSVYALRFRVALLDDAGVPIPGEGNGYVSKLISIGSTPQLLAGETLQQRDGAGDLCINITNKDTITRYDLASAFCTIEQEMLALVTGGTVISSAGVPIGWSAPRLGATPPNICVEAWSAARSGSTHATDDDGNLLYWHHAWPLTAWTPGAETYENGVSVVPLAGHAEENENMPAGGPFGDWPAGIVEAENKWLDDALPDVECGAIEVPAGS